MPVSLAGLAGTAAVGFCCAACGIRQLGQACLADWVGAEGAAAASLVP